MKEAFIKLHLSVLIAGGTGIFGRLITLNEGLLVWYRMLLAGVLFYIVLFLLTGCFFMAVSRRRTYPSEWSVCR